MNHRGQSALEYLMTYGWALVVIVIVVAALVLLVGNPGQGSDVCSGPGSAFNIVNQNLDTDGWELVVSNISGRSLTSVTFFAFLLAASLETDSTICEVIEPSCTSLADSTRDPELQPPWQRLLQFYS